MRVTEYGAGDAEAVEAGRLVLNASHAVDAPWVPPRTHYRETMFVRYGWDASPERHLLAWVDGVPVGVAVVELGEWDNRDLAWCDLYIHPEHRRRGYGAAFLAHVQQLSSAAGRTKFGASGYQTPAAEAFARRHGFALASVEVHRVVQLDTLAPGTAKEARAEAEPFAAAYDLVRLEGRTPDTLLPAVAELTTAINDAPLDDLLLEDEVFPTERILDYEDATIESGHRLYRVLARHRESGALAGHCVVAVDTESPQFAHQHDTSVVRSHRGHRLGLLLKADTMCWLAEEEPQVTSISTWNAESNDRMIGINERLGYRAMGRRLAFQRMP